MVRMELRPHQREAVDAVLKALEDPSSGLLPQAGLRTQVVMATGSGKTLVAARSAAELRARRVLVLVPSLDLLAQTEAAWRVGGRAGAVLGVSSLRESEAGFANTTVPEELVRWTAHLEQVTVFSTYASLGLGTLERAHQAGLPAWDLIVVDEAHRTSGRVGKPWAVVHDNARIPAARRLYMTATPRLWQAGEEPGCGDLVASMEDNENGLFGARCYTLTLSEAIDRHIVAPYQVVCLDITDAAFQTAKLLGAEQRSDKVRGTRMAALQTAVVKAAASEGFTRTLVFHHQVKEAEAFATGLPDIAEQLHVLDPELYPRAVWADWLCGEHSPAYRRRVLDDFAVGTAADGTKADKSFLGSVRVLGEGVDTKECDSVFWADLRGSMPDLVQAVGRALRMKPGEGKVASLVVPVLLGPGETPDDMLTSRAYGGLAKLLEALRAHDTRIVETLAEPQAPSRYTPLAQAEMPAEWQPDTEGISGPAHALLKFSTHRNPAKLATFIKLRVLEPEKTHWLRGLEAAMLYRQEHGALRVPFTYKAPQPGETHAPDNTQPKPAATEAELRVLEQAVADEDQAAVDTALLDAAQGAHEHPVHWPATLAGFPLGQWIADARRSNAGGRLSDERVKMLDELGMVWSERDVAWEEGLTAARGWSAQHGHLLAPVSAVWQGHPVGVWLKNARASARRTAESEQRQAEGLEPLPLAWSMPEERRAQLEDIDPAWCPAWPVAWQRAFTLLRRHIEASGQVPQAPREILIQGEDLGQWVRAQRWGWHDLEAGQQWLLKAVLGLEPASAREKAQAAGRMSQADKWTLNLTAATQYHQRQGHLNVPRKHVEPVPVDDGGLPASDTPQRQIREVKLGAFVSNARNRKASLTTERIAQLDAIAMRWT
ncbi:Helicase associated domain protein [Streptomyces sp. ISL-87]|uniref:DEAD/DEAH box helicase n=1 Tax=Streptomyces sp. ISL-87 TaxID=2819188 RepID=UPI001BED1667|nr:DEAD/DEAH box helicase [Streptomyces sp. ISL-87]MBT2611414.1 Helicase associated domain protein [Streptomyces sp. ISL-87]